MKAKQLVALVVVAVVLVGVAYLRTQKKQRHAEVESQLGKEVVVALQDADRANSIERISFLSAVGTVTVARVDGTWVAPSKYGYPLDFEKVAGFVRSLAELKVGQVVPPGEAEWKALDLVAPAGTRVELTDGAGKVVAAVQIGKKHESTPATPGQFGGYGGYPDGRFVAAGETACLVTETFMDLPDDPRDWLDKEILNVTASDIVAASVKDSAGNGVAFKRPDGGGDLALVDLAADEKMAGYKANDVANLFSYLNLNDVADPALTDEDMGIATGLVVVAKSKQGQTYTAIVGGSLADGSDRYLRVRVAYTAPADPVVEVPEDETGEAAKKRAEDGAKRKAEQEKLALETSDLNAKLAQWTYLVSSYKVDDVTTDRAHFAEKKVDEKVEAVEEAGEGEETDEVSDEVSE